MVKKSRILPHEIETVSKDNIRSIINADGRGLFRELTERDYGIDAMVEVFEEGFVTGKFGLIQCKGKKDAITPLVTCPDYVSCPGITRANIQYLEQDNTAVIVTYGSMRDRNSFYYADLKEILSDNQIEALNSGTNNTKVTVRIPIANNAEDNIDGFFEIINRYYPKG